MKTIKTFTMWATALCMLSLLLSLTTMAQTTPKLNDAEIASVGVTANQIDVDYAAIALKKSKTRAIRQFAQTMRDDHSAVIAAASKLAAKLGVTPKTNTLTQSLLDGAKKETKALNSKSGKAFDKAYIDNEVAYHEAVINAVKNVLIPQISNEELKDFFVKIAPTLESHLEHAKMVQKELK